MGAAAAPIAGAAIGGALNYMGQKKAASASKKASQNAEHARREAVQFTQPQNIYQMANWLFPGAVRNPNTSFANPANSLGTAGASGGGGGKSIPWAGPTASVGGGAFPLGMAMGGLMPGLLLMALAGKNKKGPFGGFNLPQQQQSPPPAAVPAAGAATGALAGGLPQLATGGPLQAGQPAIVGEDGPEIFAPTQPGTVVPNPVTPLPGVGAAPAPVAGGGGGGLGGLFGGLTASNNPFMNLFQNFMKKKKQGQQAPAQNFQPTSTVGGPDLGTLSVQHAQNFLQNPGEISTIQYERAQEQANQGLNANVQGIMGALTGMGISPRSGFGQNLLQSAATENTRVRNLAARDLALQQEQLKRTDIAAGLTAYQNFLNQVFGIVGTQAGAAGGGSFPSVPAINPYENLSQAIAMGGSLLGNNSGGGTKPYNPNTTYKNPEQAS